MDVPSTYVVDIGHLGAPLRTLILNTPTIQSRHRKTPSLFSLLQYDLGTPEQHTDT